MRKLNERELVMVNGGNWGCILGTVSGSGLGALLGGISGAAASCRD